MKTDFINLAIRNIKNRKLRTFLTLLGILISIATIFVLISVSLGLERAVQEQFRLLGTDKFFIQPRGQLAGPGTGGAVSFSQEDIDVVEKISGVKEVSAWTATSAKIELKSEIRFVTAIGIDLDTSDLFFETGAYETQDGRVLKKGDKKDIMIGSQYKENNLFKRPVAVRDEILINDVPFTVRGILKPIGNPGDDRLIYMPSQEFRTLFNIPSRIDTIVVQVSDAENLKSIAYSTERKLMKSRDVTETTKDFTI